MQPYDDAIAYIPIVAAKTRAATAETIEARNHQQQFRLNGLFELAEPILLAFTALADQIAAGVALPKLTLLFLKEQAAAPLDQMINNIGGYASNTNPANPQTVEAFGSALANLQKAHYAINLARAAVEASALDEVLPTVEKTKALRAATETLLVSAKEAKTQAALALDTVRAAAAEQGVAENAKAFDEAARAYQKTANSWAIGAAVFGVVLIAVASIAILRHPDGPPEAKAGWTTAANLNYFAERLLLASVVSFAMVTCVRNFRAATHSAVLNEHRKRALQTFQQFRAGTGDERMKDAVLLQAAEAAFSMQASGFADGPIGVTHAHELLELVKPGGKG